MSTGQCHTDPVTGISGDIWNAWILSDTPANLGIGAAVLTSGGPIRAMIAAHIEAIAASISANATSGHHDGASVAWAAGSGLGQISMGAACPHGTFVSATGCDEGGLVTITSGANTIAGEILRVNFAVPWPAGKPPATIWAPANANASALYFGNQMEQVSTENYAAPIITVSAGWPNQNYSFYWINQGRR